MRTSSFLFALLTSALAGAPALAADAARIVELGELDQPPRRDGFHPVVVPEALRSSGASDNVSLIATIGVDGAVAKLETVKASSPETAAAAAVAVKRWHFTPCFSNGEPVSFRLPVTIAIRPGQEFVPAAESSVPVEGASPGEQVGITLGFETIPEYPAALQADPVDGVAHVNLLVGADGAASDPVVEFASRSEFAPNAAAAVLGWKFSPAKRDGKAIAARTSVDVRFAAKSAAWTADDRDFHARLRYARDYDVGPQQRSTVPVVFPYDALLAQKFGGVSLAVVVTPEGHVAKITPDPGADPDFAGAAHASLGRWTFSPATKAGEPVFAVITMVLTFEPQRDEFRYDESTFDLITHLRNDTAQIAGLKDVDQKPVPVSRAVPVLPFDHTGPTAGEAMIEILIDAAGRAQLPRIVRATTPELGWAAATAAAQWRFEPAMKAGLPVICRARIPIKFATVEKPAATP